MKKQQQEVLQPPTQRKKATQTPNLAIEGSPGRLINHQDQTGVTPKNIRQVNTLARGSGEPPIRNKGPLDTLFFAIRPGSPFPLRDAEMDEWEEPTRKLQQVAWSRKSLCPSGLKTLLPHPEAGVIKGTGRRIPRPHSPSHSPTCRDRSTPQAAPTGSHRRASNNT